MNINYNDKTQNVENLNKGLVPSQILYRSIMKFKFVKEITDYINSGCYNELKGSEVLDQERRLFEASFDMISGRLFFERTYNSYRRAILKKYNKIIDEDIIIDALNKKYKICKLVHRAYWSDRLHKDRLEFWEEMCKKVTRRNLFDFFYHIPKLEENENEQ